MKPLVVGIQAGALPSSEDNITILRIMSYSNFGFIKNSTGEPFEEAHSISVMYTLSRRKVNARSFSPLIKTYTNYSRGCFFIQNENPNSISPRSVRYFFELCDVRPSCDSERLSCE